MTAVELEEVKARRGASNGNAAGSSSDRRRRRAWLIVTYRANEDAIVVARLDGMTDLYPVPFGTGTPAARCYRCGRLVVNSDDAEEITLLHDPNRLTVDRILPGCRGGTYRRNNVRPACGPCNSETGGGTRS